MSSSILNGQEKIGWPQWKALFATLTGWTLDAMDWMFLALALPLIIKEWNLDLAMAGLLGGGTLIGVGISSFFFGSLGDIMGRTKALMITMIGYSILTALCGLTQSFTQLFILRIIVGIFLGGEWGIGATLLNEYWPARRRGQAMSTVQSGWAIGYGIACLIYAVVAPLYGWRVLFFIGIVPAIAAVIIRYYVPEPEVWVKADKERKELAKKKHEGQQLTVEEHAKTKFPLVSLFSPVLLRYTILSIIMCMGVTMAYWGAATWLPSFLATAKGLSIVKTGMYLFWLNVGAIAGYQLFGYLGDRYSRRFSFGLGLLLSVGAVLIYINLGSTTAMLFFGPVYGFITYGFYGMFGVVLSELFPPYCRATATNFCFNFGRGLAFFGPYIIGALAKSSGLSAAISLTSVLYFVAWVALMLIPEPRKIDEARTKAGIGI